MPDCAEMSANVNGERACGPGAGGFFGKSGVAYERPVRSGEGVGEGCCAKALMQIKPQKSTSGNLCPIYSYLNASFGSTFVALYAGMKQASIAIAVRNIAMAM